MLELTTDEKIPLGLAAAHRSRLYAVLQPVLDLM